MSRLPAFALTVSVVFAVLGACQGPEAFYRTHDAGNAPQGGHTGGGIGGFRGAGGSGVGGFRGTGGAPGIGGAPGLGGFRGAGGMTGAGDAGTGGMSSTGDAGTGGRGAGGSGFGGRTGDAGTNCLTTFQANNYTVGSLSCGACLDHTTSIAPKCMAMIDCLAAKYPCTGNCQLDCFNSPAVSGSGTLSDCINPILAAACP